MTSVDGQLMFYELANPWFQIAIELALVCLFGRAEVVAARYDNIIEGRLRYVRKKTQKKSKTAYVAIEMTSVLDDVVQRSRQLPSVALHCSSGAPKNH